MTLISKGNHKAFTQLFDRYSRRVLGYSRRILGRQEAAEEISQEVWMKVIKAASNYNDEGKFSSWLITITRNSCLNRIQDRSEISDKHDAFDEGKMVDGAADLESTLLGKHETKSVKKAFDQLSELQRAAISLRWLEELSYEEIAVQLKTSVPSVKSLIFRARQNLQDILGGLDE